MEPALCGGVMRKPVVDGVVAHGLGAHAVLKYTPTGEGRPWRKEVEMWGVRGCGSGGGTGGGVGVL
jgi:hypothetical protein